MNEDKFQFCFIHDLVQCSVHHIPVLSNESNERGRCLKDRVNRTWDRLSKKLSSSSICKLDSLHLGLLLPQTHRSDEEVGVEDL